ncbi:phenylacetate--CoA ligase family protein [Pseudomonas sp. GV085]|uniref:phenylacetate--CoA ligase family protein n=1 Tax=Pseudomonas sp. GV085 TaxID=2135756 RepID=UPI000D35A547|nr:phenylacetate--CoA ligase family protein [Pseudomonas sp. GV085]PTR21139.1 phenylacetate-CoA ligase [Pseudomonas sp. GV085]
MLFSLKHTLKSIWRDFIIGWRARYLIYPKIARNEYSSKELSLYTDLQALQLKIQNPTNVTGFSIISDKHNCIDKNSVLSNPKAFIRSRSIKTLLRNHISTSGSTGRPLTLVQDINTVVREEAFVYRQLRWAGYRNGDRRAWLRGDIVCTDKPRQGVYGCRDWWSNTLMLSSYHISSNTIRSYIDALEAFDPVLIQAYPSSIYALASWMITNGVQYSGPSLSSIVTSSETLEPAMQELIEKAFGCRVLDWYGQAERVVAIGTCEHGSHHVLTDYGMVELLPENDGLYELVGTNYNNHAMRLMRYRTGDLVRIGPDSCPCGRVFPVVDTVIGRRDKIITLPDGRKIGRLDHVFKGMNNVVEGQVVYRGEYRFILRVVPGPEWLLVDAERLVHQLKQRIEGLIVEVETVAAIPRGPNGKFEFVRIEENA